MAFAHEQLDVYRAAIEYVGWAHRLCRGLKGEHRIVAMLTKLGKRGYTVRETVAEYQVDSDGEADSDPDSE